MIVRFWMDPKNDIMYTYFFSRYTSRDLVKFIYNNYGITKEVVVWNTTFSRMFSQHVWDIVFHSQEKWAYNLCGKCERGVISLVP